MEQKSKKAELADFWQSKYLNERPIEGMFSVYKMMEFEWFYFLFLFNLNYQKIISMVCLKVIWLLRRFLAGNISKLCCNLDVISENSFIRKIRFKKYFNYIGFD